jgi:hypothetical protein
MKTTLALVKLTTSPNVQDKAMTKAGRPYDDLVTPAAVSL